MSGFFWMLLGCSAVVAGLVFFALPFGPDLIYLALVGPLYGAVFLLGWRERDRERLGVPPP